MAPPAHIPIARLSPSAVDFGVITGHNPATMGQLGEQKVVLHTYRPKEQGDRCTVTINSTAFRFSALAGNVAKLSDIHWMRVHTDSDERLIVFEPLAGIDKAPDSLKLGTRAKGYKTLIAKGLISRTPWIKAIVGMPVDARKFELKEYSGLLPTYDQSSSTSTRRPWYIQLMPAFEKSISPSEINQLDSNAMGIYRYRGGNDGEEVIYIGKGNIRERFQQESGRLDWNISRIEYSILQGEGSDQKAIEWESWWIQRFRRENNGRRPRYNQQDGHRQKFEII